MIHVKPKRLAEVSFVTAYALDLAIRKRQVEIEQVFAALVPQQSMNTNVPDEFNPAVPRIVMKQPGVEISFSQLAAQISFRPQAQEDQNPSAFFDTVAGKIRRFHSLVGKIKRKDEQNERGLIVILHYPSDSPILDVQKHLYDRFISFQPLGKIAAVSVTLGFRAENDLFVNLANEVYELRQGEIQAGQTWVDIKAQTLVEYGINVRLDVNDRPRNEEGLGDPQGSTDLLLNTVRDLACNQMDTILGVGPARLH